MPRGVIDIFALYQFLRRLATPFESWEAYKTGVIDKDGEVIIKKGDRTMEQDGSWGYFDRLVANLKKLLAKVPGGKTRLASYAAALLLLRESEGLDIDDMDLLQEKLDYYMTEAEMLIEEAPGNAVGGGHIAGVGIGPQGEPGLNKKQINNYKSGKNKKKTVPELLGLAKGLRRRNKDLNV